MAPPSPAALVVRAALGDDDLDPAVRDLALERLEAQLLALAQSKGSYTGLALSLRDGTITLDPPDKDRVLLDMLERALIAAVAPTVGAARLAVRNGERPRGRVSPVPVATPASYEALTMSLLRLVAAQQRALDATLDDATRHTLHKALAEAEAIAESLHTREPR
jgi:hypothetical protein